jgi:hypothetical protein
MRTALPAMVAPAVGAADTLKFESKVMLQTNHVIMGTSKKVANHTLTTEFSRLV